MRTINQIYEQYQIMPQLVTHMLRVAGVGKLITDSWEDRELAGKSVKACLLHDLGNIAKFDLQNPMMNIDNLPYWQEVQKEVWDKYGREAHAATYAMLEELKLGEYVEYLKAEAKLYETEDPSGLWQTTPRPAMVVLYADLRVIPSGVVGMEERISDLEKRYGEGRAEARWGKQLEEYMQTLTSINVREICESAVTPLFTELLGYNV